MFLKAVIRQGNTLVKQSNIIKQLKEENEGLRDELAFTEIDKEGFIADIEELIEKGEKNKKLYVDIIKDIKKELADRKSN